jgi:Holliday junction resolvasome RuvABC endonuclease subunit
MMTSVQVVGFDPSLRNWGIAVGEYRTATQDLIINNLDVVRPVEPQGKQVRQNSKDLVSARQLTEGIVPYAQAAQALFVEVPVGSQSAMAMKGYGVCIGILGALQGAGIPFIMLTPTEVKLASVGSKTATKNQMIEWAMDRFPDAPWPMQTIKGKTSVVAGTAEHMADSCATIVAGLQSEEFLNALRLAA